MEYNGTMKEGEKVKGKGCLGSIFFLIPIIIILIIFGFMMRSGYNGMVEKQESVEAQWAQVENTYQRRADLVMNLAETVKGYAKHEQSTLTGVIEARAKATSVNINAKDLNPDMIKNYQAAQSGISSSLSKLMVVVEKYPDLKANQGFLKLQSQLEQIENTILVERAAFNEAARVYNTYIRKFPKNFYASWFDFETKGYFEAKEGADEAPQIKF